jgi:hypothetical protein
VGQRLVRLHVPGAPDDELGINGSAGTGVTQVDCFGGKRSGKVVVTYSGPDDFAGRRYRVARTVYRIERAAFRLVSSHVVKLREAQAVRLERRWGLGGLPFRSCAVARGRYAEH